MQQGILIYTKHGSTHMPIEVTDEASLNIALQDILRMSQKVCRPRLIQYFCSTDTPWRLLHIPVLSYTRKHPLEKWYLYLKFITKYPTRYSRNVSKELLILLYTRFNVAIRDFRCQLPGPEPNIKSTATKVATTSRAVDSHQYRCYCTQCEKTPARPCGRDLPSLVHFFFFFWVYTPFPRREP